METLKGVVEALKGQPSLLAMTVANLALLAFIFYAMHSAATFRDTLVGRVFELQARMAACGSEGGK